MTRKVHTVIIGAGLAGLSTAYHLGDHDYLILEKEDAYGGLATTEEMDGFRFDWTGHWLHLRLPHIRSLIEQLMGNEISRIERDSLIWSSGGFTQYPFQSNFHGLPIDIVKECLWGAIKANIEPRNGDPQNFVEYIRRHFGDGIARHFMVPYNSKLWGIPLDELTTEWCNRFIPRPTLEHIVDGALGIHHKIGYNVSFMYPNLGGINHLPSAIREQIPIDKILLNVDIRSIDSIQKNISTDAGLIHYENLISTIPLPSLIDLIENAPKSVLKKRSLLRWNSLRFMDLGIRADNPFDEAHWIYVPEEKYPIYRIGSYSNVASSMAPKGFSSCYVEFTNSKRPDDNELRDSVKRFLVDTGTIKTSSDIVFDRYRNIPVAYVIFDHNHRSATELIQSYLKSEGIKSIGRYGKWTYAGMEDAIDDGYQTAMEIIKEVRREELGDGTAEGKGGI